MRVSGNRLWTVDPPKPNLGLRLNMSGRAARLANRQRSGTNCQTIPVVAITRELWDLPFLWWIAWTLAGIGITAGKLQSSKSRQLRAARRK